MNFGRVMTAMITPFDAEGQVNYAVAEKLADYLVTQGSDALVVCGTTGESPVLSWEEEYELFRVVKQAVADRARIIAGTGSNSTAEAVTHTQKAAQLGLSGSLQVVPYYNKPPQEGLYQHFRAIAAASPDFPVILYNIPGRTGQNLQPETVARLAEIPNIVAIKEASGNLDQVSQIRRLTPPEFALYSGDDSLTLPLLAVGGQGVISVASHVAGPLIQQMVQAFQAGQVQVASELHSRLFPLFKALFIMTNPIPVKAALRLRGWAVGVPRLPLCDITPEAEAIVKTALSGLALL
ncbi:4-hydroxy-tetrahydrodipicolinate synthase [Trichothermofontia sp.]